MVNAGIEILGFDGNQSYDAANSQWVGIKVRVNYPQGQDSTNNPIALGDSVIEPSGKIWTVNSVLSLDPALRTFELALQLANDTPSPDISPDLGLVTRGAVVTPVNGYIVPHWNATLVSVEAGRIANMYNTRVGGNNASSITEGVLPVAVVPDIDTVKVTGLDAALADKTDVATFNALDLAVQNINTLLASDDTTLDQLQEIVNFIKLNRATLDTLGIGNIAGLQAALDGKLSTTGTAAAAAKLATARIIALGGDLSGGVSFDGSGNVTLNAAVVDNSHNHTIANVTNLQATLDGKAAQKGTATVYGGAKFALSGTSLTITTV